MAVLNALQINHFYPIPELYELCPRMNNPELKVPGPLDVNDMHALALYNRQEATGIPDPADYFLPDLGMVKLRGNPGKNQMTLVAVAGYNGAPHNHNDIGSFQVFARGRMLLTDPGAPLYNSKTFSSNRYDIIYCRSRGHSVPLINGREQKEGKQYRGTLRVEGLNQPGSKCAFIDMSKAYPHGRVKRLLRTLALDTAANHLTIEDAYEFRAAPKELEEAFITFEKAVVMEDGQAVRIGPVHGGGILRSEQPGHFQVESVQPAPEDLRPNSPATLQRITFIPHSLKRNMTLRFTLQ